jgi:hypothetical protein
MGGLGFLLTIILYVVIAVFAIRAFKRRRAKIIAAVIAVLLPTMDAVIGRTYLSHLCETEGGLVVNKVDHEAKGFRILGGVFSGHESDDSLRAWLSEHRVSYIEGEYRKDGTVDRVWLENGVIKRERNVLSWSTIEVAYMPADVDELYPRDVYVARNVLTGEVLGTYTLIGFRGGWAEHSLGWFSDAGPGVVSWCQVPRGEDRRAELVKRVIAR